MGSLWAHRGLAFVFVMLLAASGFGLPALAGSANGMEAILARYDVKGDNQLEWLNHKLDGAETDEARIGAYNTAVDALSLYADQAMERLVWAAGTDPELVAMLPEFETEVAEMEQSFLKEAEKLLDEALSTPTTTTTIKVELPPVTTTTTLKVEVPAVTTTLPPLTTTTVAPTTTTTTTTTSTPPIDAIPTAGPTTSTTTVAARSGGDLSKSDDRPLVAIADGYSEAGDSEVLGTAVTADVALRAFYSNIDRVPAEMESEMLVAYVPADLPSRALGPMTGFFAVFQMVLAAFLASFRRLVGPAAAGGLYLIYEVWRHLRSKTPGSLVT